MGFRGAGQSLCGISLCSDVGWVWEEQGRGSPPVLPAAEPRTSPDLRPLICREDMTLLHPPSMFTLTCLLLSVTHGLLRFGNPLNNVRLPSHAHVRSSTGVHKASTHTQQCNGRPQRGGVLVPVLGAAGHVWLSQPEEGVFVAGVQGWSSGMGVHTEKEGSAPRTSSVRAGTWRPGT